MESFSQVTLEGHADHVYAIAEIESRGIIVSTSRDNTLKAWSLDDATCRDTINTIEGPFPGRVAALDDTNLLVTGFDLCVRIVRVTDGRELAGRHFAHPISSCAVISPTVAVVGDLNGNLFKLKFEDDKIRILQEVEEAHKEYGEVSSIHVHGNKFSTTIEEGDKTVKLWDTETLSLIHTFEGYKETTSDCTFNDTYLVVAAFEDDAIFVHNVETYELITTIRGYTHSIECVCLVEDTDILIAGGGERVLALYSLPSGDCIAKYDVGIWIRAITLLSSGKVAVGGEMPNTDIKILDIPELRNSKASEEKVNASLLRVSTVPNGQMKEQEHENVNSYALKLYREAVERGGRTFLTIDDATDVLNTLVIDKSKKIDAAEFERVFLEVSDDIHVTESAFLQVLRKMNHPHVDFEVFYSTIFKKYINKRDVVSISYAIRVLRECFKNAKDQNLIVNPDQKLANDASLRESMAKFDQEGNGNLNCDSFVAAALTIIHQMS